jgi:Flp pilus assembly protein TadD
MPTPPGDELSLQAQACWQLATDKADRGDLEEALQHCREVLRERPTMAEAYRLQARIFDGLNRLGEASASLRQALILEPQKSSDHFLLGALLERSGDRRRALDSFRSALSLLEGQPEEAWTRAAAAQAVERLEKDA